MTFESQCLHIDQGQCGGIVDFPSSKEINERKDVDFSCSFRLRRRIANIGRFILARDVVPGCLGGGSGG